MALRDALPAKRPTAPQHVVTLAEVCAVLDWDESRLQHVEEVADGLGLRLADDWADRPSVSAEDARRLFRQLRSEPPPNPHAGARVEEQAYVPPPVRDRHGHLVAAIQRPGDGSDNDSEEWL